MTDRLDGFGVVPTWGTDRSKYGPEYPKLGASVERFRRSFRDGLNLSSEDRAAGRSLYTRGLATAYGEAVLKAVRSLQRSEIMRATAPLPAPYRGRNSYEIGNQILARVRGQQQARLSACPGAVRRARDDKTWREMYDKAMTDKRKPVLAAKPVHILREPSRKQRPDGATGRDPSGSVGTSLCYRSGMRSCYRVNKSPYLEVEGGSNEIPSLD